LTGLKKCTTPKQVPVLIGFRVKKLHLIAELKQALRLVLATSESFKWIRRRIKIQINYTRAKARGILSMLASRDFPLSAERQIFILAPYGQGFKIGINRTCFKTRPIGSF